jgi:hypothetical protein
MNTNTYNNTIQIMVLTVTMIIIMMISLAMVMLSATLQGNTVLEYSVDLPDDPGITMCFPD